mmetsp:Transcript_41002/g.67415  ORF Transcript_41002/g.67415 Transcript_41002/m.67415 type:complete len:221 (+) Transcript_41002:66-728(+)
MSTVNNQYADDEEDMGRCKRTCKSNKLFHGVDMFVSFMILCCSFVLLAEIRSFAGFLLPTYFAVFACLIFGFAVYTPKWVHTYCPFYCTFFGRGMTYLMLGSVTLAFDHHGFSIATGSIAIVTAFIYFSFCLINKWCNGSKFACTELPVPIIVRGEDDDTERNNQLKQQHSSSESETEIDGMNKTAAERALRALDKEQNIQEHTATESDRALAVMIDPNL